MAFGGYFKEGLFGDYRRANKDMVFESIKRMKQTVAEVGSKFEVFVVPVFPVFSLPVNQYALGIWHPTPAGHQLIAGTLVKAVSID